MHSAFACASRIRWPGQLQSLGTAAFEMSNKVNFNKQASLAVAFGMGPSGYGDGDWVEEMPPKKPTHVHVTVAHWLTHDADRARCHFGHLRCQLAWPYSSTSAGELTYDIYTKGFVCGLAKGALINCRLRAWPFSLGQNDAVADVDVQCCRLANGKWRMALALA